MSLLRNRVCFQSLAVIGVSILLILIAWGGPIAPASATPLSANDLKEYQTAFRAVDKDRWDVALKHAARAQNTLPAKAITWLYLLSPSSGARFQEIQQFIEANPDWPKLDQLRLRAEQALTASTPDAEILGWFRDHPPQTGAGFLLYADTLERNGLGPSIPPLAVRVWREIDMTASEEQAFRKKYRHMVPVQDEIYRFDRQIWERNLTAALRQARRVPDAYRLLADARIRLARRSGGVDAAIQRVPPQLQNHPGLVYERMRWRRSKGMTQGAIELLAMPDLQSDHPEAWWNERAILSRNLLEDGKPEEAYRIASQHRVPDGADFAEAEWFSGWVALRFLGDPERAFPHFRDMYNNVGYPVSRSRAAYWAGRAAEAAGKLEIAQQWYHVASIHQTSFYGQLAAMKLPIGLKPPPIAPIPVSASDRATFQQWELVKLAPLLAQIGAEDTLKAVFRHLARTYHTPAILELTAELATTIGRYDLAVYTSREAIKTEVVTTRGYPVLPANDSRIGDLTIVFGLIRQESGFDIGAVSRAGARGLMQLMPATAKLVARWENVNYQRDALTDQPAYNIRLGSAYLKDLLEKFDDTLPMAFAGYNAGPHRVNNWISRFGDPRQMDLEQQIDWIESIPFGETRNYVQRVLENINVYRQLEAGHPVPISMTDGTG